MATPHFGRPEDAAVW